MTRTWHANLHWSSAVRLAGYTGAGMAKLRSVSLRQIERHFHDVMKLRVAEYLHHLRMRDAEIFLHADLRIFEVSTLLGYCRPEHFTRAFRRHSGLSPTEWTRGSSRDRFLEASAFLRQYCELLEERAADTVDPDERKRLRARIPYGCVPQLVH